MTFTSMSNAYKTESRSGLAKMNMAMAVQPTMPVSAVSAMPFARSSHSGQFPTLSQSVAGAVPCGGGANGIAMMSRIGAPQSAPAQAQTVATARAMAPNGNGMAQASKSNGGSFWDSLTNLFK